MPDTNATDRKVESPLAFGLRVAREWYSGGHGDLAVLIAGMVLERERDSQSRRVVGFDPGHPDGDITIKEQQP